MENHITRYANQTTRSQKSRFNRKNHPSQIEQFFHLSRGLLQLDIDNSAPYSSCSCLICNAWQNERMVNGSKDEGQDVQTLMHVEYTTSK